MELAVVVVDYTVPFENYREHLGVIWLLNHVKVRPPDGSATWDAAAHYAGYFPHDRDRPKRVADIDLDGVDLVYVTDTYGVYDDDLKGIEEQRAHMDYNPLHFGGLSIEDADTLIEFAAGGGQVIAEFNSFVSPTPKRARERLEVFFSVRWTGWVGRVFADPADRNDVPHWFPREFAQQFPKRPYPTGPTLVLAREGGTLAVFEAEEIAAIAPQIAITALGHERFPSLAHSRSPYYSWFALLEPVGDVSVFATMNLPDLPEVDRWRNENRIVFDLVGFATNAKGNGSYFAGDFGDMDFDPGPFAEERLIERNAKLTKLGRPSQAPQFWRFYSPIVVAMLKETSTMMRTDAGSEPE